MLSMSKRLSVSLGAFMLLCATAAAQQQQKQQPQQPPSPQQQQPQQQGECFSVVIPNSSDVGSLGSIKINRCTGESWMLVRTSLGNGVTALRWFPISVETGEASARVPQ
jgi:hypothetical protein